MRAKVVLEGRPRRLGGVQGGGRDLEEKKFFKRPEMVGQASGNGGGAL